MKTLFRCALLIAVGVSFASQLFAQENKTTQYENVKSKVSFTVPEDFKLNQSQDLMAMWLGPNVQGKPLSIHVNVMPIPEGLDMEQMFQSNFDSYKKNTAQYTGVAQVTLPQGQAFIFEESGASKAPDELHRKHLMIWNNGFQSNVMIGGAFAAFGEKKDMIDAFFKSVTVPEPPKESSGCSLMIFN